MRVKKLEYPATGLQSVTRVSSELMKMVCHPPPESPATATRLGSAFGWSSRMSNARDMLR